MQQPTEIPEIQVLKDKIDLTHYYQPEYGLLDFANSKEEYSVAQDDSHPNHVCYREWFNGFVTFL